MPRLRISILWMLVMVGLCLASGSSKGAEEPQQKRTYPEAAARRPVFEPATIRKVKDLSPAALAKQPAVQIEGIVTYYDGGSHSLFVQDSTAGIYVRIGFEDYGLRVGDVVRVEGIAAGGRISNVIKEPYCTVVGHAALPPPRVLSPQEINSTATDADRVQVTGVLRSIGAEGGRLIYHLGVGTARIKVTIDSMNRGASIQSVGRNVSVTGVHYGLYNEKREQCAMGILVPSLQAVSVDYNGAPAPRDLPVVHVNALEQVQSGKMARVQVLTDRYVPGQLLVGHDSSGVITIHTSQQDAVKENTAVDVIGYVVQTNGATVMEDAYFQRVGFENSRSFGAHETMSPLPLLEAVADVRRLSPGEAKMGYPVRVRGVITYYDPIWSVCFLQGISEGIFVNTRHQPLDIEAGLLVTLSGYTAEGDFAPIITKPKFDVEGNAPMPAEKMLPYASLLTGAQDSQWLRVQCRVRVVTDLGHLYQLEISPMDAPDATARVFVPKGTARETPADLQGAEAVIDAVCATDFGAGRRLKGLRFFCPSFRHIVVTTAPVRDPFQLDVTPIGAAFQFLPNSMGRDRIHVLGTVTWTDGRGSFYVQDATGGLRVEGKGLSVAVGEQLHVAGSRSVRNGEAALERAVIHAVGPGAAVSPGTVTAGAACAQPGEFEGRVLRMEGRVLDVRPTLEGQELLLQQGGTLYSAEILRGPDGAPQAPALADVSPASTVSLIGVARFVRDANAQVRALQLLLRTPGDVFVVRRPPIWNPHRMALAAAIAGALGICAMLWIVVLRRQVARHKAVLDANLETQRALQAKVLQSQKMDSIGNLAGGIAHDFNNILTVIIGYLGVLQEETLQPMVADIVNEIAGAANRAADLTRQLLLFSRRQVAQPAVLDINEIVRGLTRMLNRILGEDIALSCSLGPDPVFVNADKAMIEQLLMNLAVNSRDAMPKGGALSITVETRALAASEKPGPRGSSDLQGHAAEARAGASDTPWVCLSITDTGVGIAPEHLPRVFDPFFTTKEVGKGTGLGLATVYGIVQQHNGLIQVRSELGRGTTFTIFFPCANAAAAQIGVEPDNVTRSCANSNCSDAVKKPTLLLVEDDHAVRRLNGETLRKAGYTVIEAASGPAALSLVRERPHIDLVITDVVMPEGMSGTELVKELKVIYPSVPVILTSGYFEFRGKGLTVPDGATFLQKPYAPATLLAAVEKVITAEPVSA